MKKTIELYNGKKYTFDEWQKRAIKSGKITVWEKLMEKTERGEPLANFYIDDCPNTWKTVSLKTGLEVSQ